MDELIVNLWAIYDASTGLVYALSGKVYNVPGDDEFKLGVLDSLARTDHLTAKRRKVPSRFQISYNDRTVKNVTMLSMIRDHSESLFDEVLTMLESELPSLMSIKNNDAVENHQTLPKEPLCIVTTLYEDEQGNIRPIITDDDREWMEEQEKARGR